MGCGTVAWSSGAGAYFRLCTISGMILLVSQGKKRERKYGHAVPTTNSRSTAYVLSPRSPTFPPIPVVEGVTQFVEMSRIAGTAPALRAFRQWVRDIQHPAV